ncbi:phosphoglycolate phosphatase [Massilia arenosa]|uniref:Phosphoglycolate phosphatase n=1 Tax=Zemynaea arenosa TaxID=2561931 RepID=A0A4Y9SLN0_9BURK|nr:phosphoglycolate phosphatase [Massilia arenosa]TFW24515.1 phosphoglycolate phosphatase [Massilia arenosa]
MTRFAHRIRAAIVDLDGTMLDTVPDFYVAINRMRADFGLHQPVTHEQIAQLVGKGSEHLIRGVLALDYDDAGVEQRIEEAMTAYQRHYIAINGDHSTLYPDVKEGLRALKEEGLKLAVVTNKPMNFAGPLLDRKGLRGYFDFVFGGDSFPKKKPDPMPLTEACKALGCPPEQVVALGDSSNDAHAARAAGCYVLTVPYGYNHGVPVHEIESDGIVDTLLEAATLIRQHNRDVL